MKKQNKNILSFLRSKRGVLLLEALLAGVVGVAALTGYWATLQGSVNSLLLSEIVIEERDLHATVANALNGKDCIANAKNFPDPSAINPLTNPLTISDNPAVTVNTQFRKHLYIKSIEVSTITEDISVSPEKYRTVTVKYEARKNGKVIGAGRVKSCTVAYTLDGGGIVDTCTALNCGNRMRSESSCPTSSTCSGHTKESCCNDDEDEANDKCQWDASATPKCVDCPVASDPNQCTNRVTKKCCDKDLTNCEWNGFSCEKKCSATTSCTDYNNGTGYSLFTDAEKARCCNKDGGCQWNWDVNACETCSADTPRSCKHRATQECCDKPKDTDNAPSCLWDGSSCSCRFSKSKCEALTSETSCKDNGCTWWRGKCTTLCQNIKSSVCCEEGSGGGCQWNGSTSSCECKNIANSYHLCHQLTNELCCKSNGVYCKWHEGECKSNCSKLSCEQRDKVDCRELAKKGIDCRTKYSRKQGEVPLEPFITYPEKRPDEHKLKCCRSSQELREGVDCFWNYSGVAPLITKGTDKFYRQYCGKPKNCEGVDTKPCEELPAKTCCEGNSRCIWAAAEGVCKVKCENTTSCDEKSYAFDVKACCATDNSCEYIEKGLGRCKSCPANPDPNQCHNRKTKKCCGEDEDNCKWQDISLDIGICYECDITQSCKDIYNKRCCQHKDLANCEWLSDIERCDKKCDTGKSNTCSYSRERCCNNDNYCKWDGGSCKKKDCPDFDETQCKQNRGTCEWESFPIGTQAKCYPKCGIKFCSKHSDPRCCKKEKSAGTDFCKWDDGTDTCSLNCDLYASKSCLDLKGLPGGADSIERCCKEGSERKTKCAFDVVNKSCKKRCDYLGAAASCEDRKGTLDERGCCEKKDSTPGCYYEASKCKDCTATEPALCSDRKSESCCLEASSKCNWIDGSPGVCKQKCAASRELMIGTNRCQIPAKNHGEEHECPNCGADYEGKKIFKCNNGTWVPIVNTCKKKHCPTKTVDIVVGKTTCTLPETEYGQTHTCSCGGSYTGSKTYTCNNGTWDSGFGTCTYAGTSTQPPTPSQPSTPPLTTQSVTPIANPNPDPDPTPPACVPTGGTTSSCYSRPGYHCCTYRDSCGTSVGSYCQPYGRGCFKENTLVTMGDGSLKPISQIKKGDKVFGEAGINNVLKLKIRKYKGLVYSINGSKHFVTAGHPFMTEEGWKAFDLEIAKTSSPYINFVGELKAGDILIKENGELEILLSYSSKEEETTVYNLQVDGDNTFYAKSYLVHNKGCFKSGTLIVMKGGDIKPIETLKEGDLIIGKSGINKVLKLRIREYEGLVYSINGSANFVTGGHPFMTKEGWKAFNVAVAKSLNPDLAFVGTLTEGDTLIKVGGKIEVLKTYSAKREKTTVYNLRVDGDSTYYANGYLVHNK